MLRHNGNISLMKNISKKKFHENKKFNNKESHRQWQPRRSDWNYYFIILYHISLLSIFPCCSTSGFQFSFPPTLRPCSILFVNEKKNCDFLFEFKIIFTLVTRQCLSFFVVRHYGSRFQFDTYWRGVTRLGNELNLNLNCKNKNA
jgi:hypothetical protein